MAIARAHGFVVDGETVSIRSEFDKYVHEYVLFQEIEFMMKAEVQKRWGPGVLRHTGWQCFMRSYVYEIDDVMA